MKHLIHGFNRLCYYAVPLLLAANHSAAPNAPTFAGGVDALAAEPTLSYDEVTVKDGYKSVSHLKWRQNREDPRFRIDTENDSNLIPTITRIYSSGSLYTIYPDFVVQETHPPFTAHNVKDYYFGPNPVISGAGEGVAATFDGRPSLKFQRRDDTPKLPIQLPGTVAAATRSDYVDLERGWWIGYSLEDAAGKVISETAFRNITIATLPEHVFSLPEPARPIRKVVDSKDFAKAVMAGFNPRLEKLGLNTTRRWKTVFIPTLFFATIFLLLGRAILVRIKRRETTNNRRA